MAEYLHDGRAALLNFRDRPLADTARQATACGVHLQHSPPPVAAGWSEVGLDAKAAAAIANARIRF
jgi:hypothetical protein